MSNVSLQPRSALASALDRSRGALLIAPLDGLTIAHVAVRNGQMAALTHSMQELFGLRLPLTPAVATGSLGVTAVWAGPGQWLLMADGANARDLERELTGKLAGIASVADQSDARTFVRVSGQNARKVLAKGVPIDLHPRAFPPAAAAITHAAHIGILIWRSDVGGEDAFTLACPRSYAVSFWSWLTHAAAEYGHSAGGAS